MLSAPPNLLDAHFFTSVSAQSIVLYAPYTRYDAPNQQVTNPPKRTPQPSQEMQFCYTHPTPTCMHPTLLCTLHPTAHTQTSFAKKHNPPAFTHTPLTHLQLPVFSLPSYTPPTPATPHPTLLPTRLHQANPLHAPYPPLSHPSFLRTLHRPASIQPPSRTSYLVCTFPTLLNAPYTRLHVPLPSYAHLTPVCTHPYPPTSTLHPSACTPAFLTRLTPVCTHPTLLNVPHTRMHAPHTT